MQSRAVYFCKVLSDRRIFDFLAKNSQSQTDWMKPEWILQRAFRVFTASARLLYWPNPRVQFFQARPLLQDVTNYQLIIGALAKPSYGQLWRDLGCTGQKGLGRAAIPGQSGSSGEQAANRREALQKLTNQSRGMWSSEAGDSSWLTLVCSP